MPATPEDKKLAVELFRAVIDKLNPAYLVAEAKGADDKAAAIPRMEVIWERIITMVSSAPPKG